MTTVTSNFNFAGQCSEALDLYQKPLGAQVHFVLRYRDADPRDFHRALTEEQMEYVYHAETSIGGQRIMLADNLTIPFEPGTALSLTVTMDTKEEVMNAFEALEDGCSVIYPPHSTTYRSCTVSFQDTFGFRWVVMTEQTAR